MEYLQNGNTEMSQRIDNDVLGLYRHFKNPQTTLLWMERQRQYLVRAELDNETTKEWEDWIMRLYATMRLQYLVKAGEQAALFQSDHYLQQSQGPEADVLDLLAQPNLPESLYAIGNGTYEMFCRRLQAMARLEVTFATSSDEYINRYCTEFRKFNEPLPDLTTSDKVLPILLSARKALQAMTFAGQDTTHKKRRAKVFRPHREQKVFITVVILVGLLMLSGAVWWFRIGQKQLQATPRPSEMRRPFPSNLQPAPVTKPEKAPPTHTGTQEKAGFYVIGLAARDEASAVQEAQQRQQEGIQTHVVYSSRWSGLTPNYYLVVYKVVNNRAEAIPVRKELEKRRIKTYVMHSGKRVQQ
jgi:hypothetical protein